MLTVGFIGPSGVGKTTLMEKVLTRLTGRGQRVSVVKSSHHATDVDRPGKDSWRYRQAGAGEVMLVGPERWALMCETQQAPSLGQILARMQPVDIVLVEGYKSETTIARILVHRRAYGDTAAVQWPENILAVATDDDTLELPDAVVRLDINNPGAVANFIVTLKANSDLV